MITSTNNDRLPTSSDRYTHSLIAFHEYFRLNAIRETTRHRNAILIYLGYALCAIGGDKVVSRSTICIGLSPADGSSFEFLLSQSHSNASWAFAAGVCAVFLGETSLLQQSLGRGHDFDLVFGRRIQDIHTRPFLPAQGALMLGQPAGGLAINVFRTFSHDDFQLNASLC